MKIERREFSVLISHGNLAFFFNKTYSGSYTIKITQAVYEDANDPNSEPNKVKYWIKLDDMDVKAEEYDLLLKLLTELKQ